MQSVGQMIPAFGLVGLSYVGCNPTIAVVLLCICVGFNGASYSGFIVNHMELSPNYAGTLMGLTNTIGTATGFIVPHVCGALINNSHTLANWWNIFMISSGVCTVGNVVFVLFASTKMQTWNTYWEQEQ